MAWNGPTLAAKSLTFTKDFSLEEILRHATNEALALAWTTPYPEFVLPVLLEEKLAAARRYSERQQLVWGWSREMLREMGCQDLVLAEAGRLEGARPPDSRPWRHTVLERWNPVSPTGRTQSYARRVD